MFVVVVSWLICRTIDLEGASSSTGQCIVQFFVPLLCCNVETELRSVWIQKPIRWYQRLSRCVEMRKTDTVGLRNAKPGNHLKQRRLLRQRQRHKEWIVLVKKRIIIMQHLRHGFQFISLSLSSTNNNIESKFQVFKFYLFTANSSSYYYAGWQIVKSLSRQARLYTKLFRLLFLKE